MWVDVRYGDLDVLSPDERLDSVVDLVAHAPEDLIRLLAEVRRLRSQRS
jgi:hypothetical protein